MQIINEVIEVETDEGIGIYNITAQLAKLLQGSELKNGQVLVL